MSNRDPKLYGTSPSGVNFPKRQEGQALASLTLEWAVMKLYKAENLYYLEQRRPNSFLAAARLDVCTL
jgi:hypothetical protein